jgi:CRP/FNR family cyclic AMP-dependent transcriptional regulator
VQPWREGSRSASNAGEVPSIDFFRNEPSVPFVHGSRIFDEGDRGDTMYAVLEGEVELRTGDRLLEIVGPGGVFGELALIDTKPRSASAISKTDGRLVELDRQRFLFLVQNTPFFALEVMQVLGERLRRMDENVRL